MRWPLPSKTGAVAVEPVAANAAGASTATATAAASTAVRRPLTRGRLRMATERPELVADEVERRHEHDRDGLREHPAEPAVDDQQMEDQEVRPERGERDDEEAHPLDPDVSPLLTERPEPVPDVVARHSDEERARRGQQIVEPRVQQRVVDRQVDEIADRAYYAELAELLPVADGKERRDQTRPRRREGGGRTSHCRPRGYRLMRLRPWKHARHPAPPRRCRRGKRGGRRPRRRG